MTKESPNHPGCNTVCVCQIKITAESVFSMNGYACTVTGAHCLGYTDECLARVTQFNELAELEKELVK